MKIKTLPEQVSVSEEKESYKERLRNHAALHLLAAMISHPKSETWTNVEMVNDSVLLANLLIKALGTNK
jgi:hypothetical protein